MGRQPIQPYNPKPQGKINHNKPRNQTQTHTHTRQNYFLSPLLLSQQTITTVTTNHMVNSIQLEGKALDPGMGRRSHVAPSIFHVCPASVLNFCFFVHKWREKQRGNTRKPIDRPRGRGRGNR